MSTAGIGRRVLVLGGTGYLGSRVIPLLQNHKHRVVAAARPVSAGLLPRTCTPLIGDALDPAFLAANLNQIHTIIQLIGTPKPAPWKGEQFRAVDRVAGLASIQAAAEARVPHFIYVSVAHPAPVMKDYIAVRTECEMALRDSGLRATVLRPWYILGPGHWWPLLLKPGYWLCERHSRWREAALRLGLLTLQEMLAALRWAVDHPAENVRILEVPGIRTLGHVQT
ncbi:hypothetical protein W02_23570 [Nitrospira sp. KM1]|uniref:SDR family oxidoreductase n=1 Tax=Nitrospira sp. KM1 TaxID=1936990 RepID=UPI0013A7278E|nr:NAD(P)H-binding protein [Nitrospira sp. KM1]BCA55217.1 hypothetical protein W02_23570 [Nitrospira sp. KM1]